LHDSRTAALDERSVELDRREERVKALEATAAANAEKAVALNKEMQRRWRVMTEAA